MTADARRAQAVDGPDGAACQDAGSGPTIAAAGTLNPDNTVTRRRGGPARRAGAIYLLAVVLSVLLVGLAVAFDSATLVPHSIIRVTLVDGRQATIPVQVPTRFVWSDPKLIRTLLASEMSLASPATAPDPLPTRIPWEQIKDVVVLQGPDYWWWADSQLTCPAAALVASLWIGVFVLRWTARRFAS